MKVKHVISSLCLASITAFGLAVGVFASHKNNSLAVKAESGDTWMFGALLDASTIPDSYRSQCNSFRFHVWGKNVDEWFDMHETGVEDLYSVNCAFTDSQVVTGGQFYFKQNEAEKYSLDLSFGYSKDSDFFGYMSWKFSDSWSGDKWTAGSQTWSRAKIDYYDTENVEHQADLTTDPATNSFIFENLEINSVNHYKPIELLIGGNWTYTYDVLYNTNETFSGSGEWFELKDEGTYDIVINNECKERVYESVAQKGIVEIKKHQDPSDTYIYYVTNSGSATVDYIYSWGGTEQFGSFPGTSIASLVTAEKAEEVTGNGVIHFQGDDQPKLIYKINIKKGYPVGDTSFMFNGGSATYKSEEREIAAEHAYWWEGPANYEAAQGLEFIILEESYRNGAEDYSVCNIDSSSAAFLVNLYNSHSDTVRETYIDSSKIYTYGDKSKKYETLVSMKKIIEQLGKISGVVPVGSSLYFDNNIFATTDSAVSIVIIVSSAVAAAALGTLLILKKKRK